MVDRTDYNKIPNSGANGYESTSWVIHTATKQILKTFKGVDLCHMYGEDESGHTNVTVVRLEIDEKKVKYQIQARNIKSCVTEKFKMPTKSAANKLMVLWAKIA